MSLETIHYHDMFTGNTCTHNLPLETILFTDNLDILWGMNDNAITNNFRPRCYGNSKRVELLIQVSVSASSTRYTLTVDTDPCNEWDEFNLPEEVLGVGKELS